MQQRYNTNNKLSVSALKIIQLLFLLNYRDIKKTRYKERGICYGFAYANAFAMLDENYDVIEQRADLLNQVSVFACKIIEEKLANTTILSEYLQNKNKYNNIIDYILSMINSYKYYNELMQLIDSSREEIIHFTQSLSIQNESGLTHLYAFFDALSGIMNNTITANRNITQQNARDLFSLFLPVKLSNENRQVMTGENIAGIFNQHHLALMLSELTTQLLAQSDITKPVAFVLSGIIPTNDITNQTNASNNNFDGHTILISFNPNNKNWYIIDTATYQLLEGNIQNTSAVATEIIREFCSEKKLTDNHSVYRGFFIHTLTLNSKQLTAINSAILATKKSTLWTEQFEKIISLKDHKEHVISLLSNCLLEASPKEILSFFSSPNLKAAANTTRIDNKYAVNYLIEARNQDNELPYLLEALHTSGISIHAKDGNGKNAMHTLISSIREKPDYFPDAIAKTLTFLIHHGIDTNMTDNRQNAPLAYAICHRERINLKLIEFLLNNNANPNATYSKDKTSMIECLLDRYLHDDLSINASDERIKEQREIEKSIIATIKLLITHGATLDQLITPPYDYLKPHAAPISLVDYIKTVQKKYEYNNEVVTTLQEILDQYAEKKAEKASLETLSATPKI